MGIGLGVVLLLLGLIFAFDVIDLPASVDDVVATRHPGMDPDHRGCARHRPGSRHERPAFALHARGGGAQGNPPAV